MPDAQRWETVGGSVRWQPIRDDDGAGLVWGCAGPGCVTYWTTDWETPKLYWWRWAAMTRAWLGEIAKRRRDNRQLVWPDA